MLFYTKFHRSAACALSGLYDFPIVGHLSIMLCINLPLQDLILEPGTLCGRESIKGYDYIPL